MGDFFLSIISQRKLSYDYNIKIHRRRFRPLKRYGKDVKITKKSKKQEKQIARETDGKKQPASGSRWHSKGGGGEMNLNETLKDVCVEIRCPYWRNCVRKCLYFVGMGNMGRWTSRPPSESKNEKK